VNAHEYLLPKAANAVDLSPWASVLPTNAYILCTSLFGDAYLVDGLGAVYMLSRAGCSITMIAPSEAHFWRALDRDDEGWQLRRLADACRAQGKMLDYGQCYGFTKLPLLGGDYVPENVWVAPWREWFSLTADVFKQTKDLPDQATVTFRLVD
jgi:hypothetical protein